MTTTKKLQALLKLAEANAPQGATEEALEALKVITEARAVIEQEPARQTAFVNLVEYSRKVESDINDQVTGWFYQWSAATDKAAKFTTADH